jgi:hypothetical protein
MDDIGVVGRETVDGRPAIIVSFAPRPVTGRSRKAAR